MPAIFVPVLWLYVFLSISAIAVLRLSVLLSISISTSTVSMLVPKFALPSVSTSIMSVLVPILSTFLFMVAVFMFVSGSFTAPPIFAISVPMS